MDWLHRLIEAAQAPADVAAGASGAGNCARMNGFGADLLNPRLILPGSNAAVACAGGDLPFEKLSF